MSLLSFLVVLVVVLGLLKVRSSYVNALVVVLIAVLLLAYLVAQWGGPEFGVGRNPPMSFGG